MFLSHPKSHGIVASWCERALGSSGARHFAVRVSRGLERGSACLGKFVTKPSGKRGSSLHRRYSHPCTSRRRFASSLLRWPTRAFYGSLCARGQPSAYRSHPRHPQRIGAACLDRPLLPAPAHTKIGGTILQKRRIAVKVNSYKKTRSSIPAPERVVFKGVTNFCSSRELR